MNKIPKKQLRKAKLDLFMIYAVRWIRYLDICVALLIVCLLIGHDTIMAVMAQHVYIISAMLAACIFACGTVVARNRKKRNETKVERHIRKLKKFFAKTVHEEYGYVTEENLRSVQHLACIVFGIAYGMEIGDKFADKSPEFFNAMVLSQSEIYALYGKILPKRTGCF